MSSSKPIIGRGFSMRRWNSFQKDLLIISVLALLHLVFTFNFPLRGLDIGAVEVTRNLLVFDFNLVQTGEIITYIPVLTMLYVGVLIGLAFVKPRPLTLIYGLGLVLVGKFSFLSQLAQLDSTTETTTITSNILSTTITQGESVVAQDIAGYVLTTLLFIKFGIVSYDGYKNWRKNDPKKSKNVQTKNEVSY